jgi:hypothetical protein
MDELAKAHKPLELRDVKAGLYEREVEEDEI